MRRLLALAAVLLAPAVAGVEPAQAPALWDAGHADLLGAVRSVAIEPTPVREGQQLRGSITFDPAFQVANVTYQICEVGNACFAIGVPLARNGTAWAFDTTDLPRHARTFLAPPSFRAGQRIGFQLSITLAGRPGPLVFPEGLNETNPLYGRDFVAWSETHYFATTIQAGTHAAPPLWPAMALVGLLALVAARRRRRA